MPDTITERRSGVPVAVLLRAPKESSNSEEFTGLKDRRARCNRTGRSVVA